MRKSLTVYIIGLIFILSLIPSYGLNISIDGQNIQFDHASGAPFIDQANRTQVPFRQTMEAFGCSVSWDLETQTAIAQKGGITVRVPIGATYILKDGQQISNDTVAIIKDGKTYLPIRAVLEAFGAEVLWDKEAQTITVLSAKRQESIPIQEIKVSTPDEFVKAIGSNRKIILEPREFNLSKGTHLSNTDHTAVWEDVDDGLQLVIQNVTNLSISGAENGKTVLTNAPRFAEIVIFKNCKGITIDNLTAGHTPMKGYICEAGVLEFEDCTDISINNSELYGCGSVGLSLDSTDHVTCDHLNINHCSLRAIDLFRSNDIMISNSKMLNHEAYSNILYASESSGIVFDNCEIIKNNYFSWSLIELEGRSDAIINNCRILDNNEKYDSSFGTAYFFKVHDNYTGESGSLQVKNTTIKRNNCDFLTDDADAVTFENCIMQDNTWN